MLEIECTNDGFPLTFAHWPGGSLESFPEVLTFKDWAASAPCRLPPPYFVDELNVSLIDKLKNPNGKFRIPHLAATMGLLSGSLNNMLAAFWQLHTSICFSASSCDMCYLTMTKL